METAPGSAARPLTVALVGNPNTGKSSLFNLLTGLRQKVGNFPGVTVEHREGEIILPTLGPARLIDLPGLYSLVARSPDERVVTQALLEADSDIFPDRVVLVADASNLKRNLFLASQVADLGLPVVLALTMEDVAAGFGLATETATLSKEMGIEVVAVNPRNGGGEHLLLTALANAEPASRSFYEAQPGSPATYWGLMQEAYDATDDTRRALAADTVSRYKALELIVAKAQRQTPTFGQTLTQRLDKVLLHPLWGYTIFLAVLFVIFQAVFALAAYPMDGIDWAITQLSARLADVLPSGWFTRLLTEGLLPGIAGILVFVPQIAILFGLTALLEDTGYMARVIFISDKIMRRFGLSGRSVVPLFSGLACAVPAIMAARTIENRRERLLTILVTPFMSCSARLPVFTVLTALAVPERQVAGFISLQGLVLLGMYLLGTFFALGSAWLLKQFVPARGRTVFMLELPWFKAPRWQNLLMEMYLKSRTFVLDAGKVILAISLILWFAASYGPTAAMQQAERLAAAENAATIQTPEQAQAQLASYRLEASYAGHLGHFIEPAIRPLGYDWRMGIALIASFAAREVFVGTMATIHSIGQDVEETTLVERLRQARDPQTGLPSYRPPVAFSLMIFYLLAMQCMSTFAIVRRETGSWPWAIGQLLGMTALAWLCSWGVYQVWG